MNAHDSIFENEQVINFDSDRTIIERDFDRTIVERDMDKHIALMCLFEQFGYDAVGYYDKSTMVPNIYKAGDDYYTQYYPMFRSDINDIENLINRINEIKDVIAFPYFVNETHKFVTYLWGENLMYAMKTLQYNLSKSIENDPKQHSACQTTAKIEAALDSFYGNRCYDPNAAQIYLLWIFLRVNELIKNSYS